MSEETLSALAAASKQAWDAGDLKAASRLLQRAREQFPEEILQQAGNGSVLRKAASGAFEPVG